MEGYNRKMNREKLLFQNNNENSLPLKKKKNQKKREPDNIISQVGSFTTSVVVRVNHNRTYDYFQIFQDECDDIELVEVKFQTRKTFKSNNTNSPKQIKKTQKMNKKEGKFTCTLVYGNKTKTYEDIALKVQVKENNKEQNFKQRMTLYVNIGLGTEGKVLKADKIRIDTLSSNMSPQNRQIPPTVGPPTTQGTAIRKSLGSSSGSLDRDLGRFITYLERNDAHCRGRDIYMSGCTNLSSGSKETMNTNSSNSSSSSGDKLLSSDTLETTLQSLVPSIAEKQFKNTEIATSLHLTHPPKSQRLTVHCSLHDLSPKGEPQPEPIFAALTPRKVTKNVECTRFRELVQQVDTKSEKTESWIPIKLFIQVTREEYVNGKEIVKEGYRMYPRFLIFTVKDESGRSIGKRAFLVDVYGSRRHISAVPVIEQAVPSSEKAMSEERVTIIGQNFAAPIMIYFGDVCASKIDKVTDSMVLCRTPIHEPGVVKLCGVVGSALRSREDVEFTFIAKENNGEGQRIIVGNKEDDGNTNCGRKRKGSMRKEGGSALKRPRIESVEEFKKRVQGDAIKYCRKENFKKLPYDKIHFACSFGLLGIVKEILKGNKKDIANKRDKFTHTPLFYAIQSEEIELVKLLISKKHALETPVSQNKDEYNLPLSYAVSVGHQAIVQLLSSKIPVNTIDHFGETALFAAVRYNNLELCRVLVDRGIDIEMRNKKGESVFEVLPEKDTSFVGIREFLEEKRYLATTLEGRSKTMQNAVLDVSKTTLGLDDLKNLSELLESDKAIAELNLNRTTLDSNGIRYLASSLADNTTLQTLLLSHNQLQANEWSLLFHALKANTGITKLDLSYSHLNAHMCRMLARALKENRSIEEVNLSGNDVKSEGFQYLADALRYNRVIRRLDISTNSIDDFPGLRSPSLIDLDLSFNKITSIPGIQGCVNLKKLDIGANSIENIPVELAKLIGTLEEVEFGGNPFVDSTLPPHFEGADGLLRYLREEVQEEFEVETPFKGKHSPRSKGRLYAQKLKRERVSGRKGLMVTKTHSNNVQQPRTLIEEGSFSSRSSRSYSDGEF